MKEIKLLIDDKVNAISITAIKPEANNVWIGTAAFETKKHMIITISEKGEIREEVQHGEKQ